jgi:hypothetical protein
VAGWCNGGYQACAENLHRTPTQRQFEVISNKRNSICKAGLGIWLPERFEDQRVSANLAARAARASCGARCDATETLAALGAPVTRPPPTVGPSRPSLAWRSEAGPAVGPATARFGPVARPAGRRCMHEAKQARGRPRSAGISVHACPRACMGEGARMWILEVYW